MGAKKVSIKKTKPGNKNQKPFERMMIMEYDVAFIGKVKMTVGIRRIYIVLSRLTFWVQRYELYLRIPNISPFFFVVSKIFPIFAAKNVYMRTSQDYIDVIRKHSAELHERFGITSMFLFGSVARNEHHEGSDVDIFVTMPPKFFNYILAAQYLEELLECPVDLICDHKNLRPFFKEQIERDGINIFTAA